MPAKAPNRGVPVRAAEGNAYRLSVAKVFHADPLMCRKWGGKLRIVAYLHDQVAIKQILEHLGLSPPEEPKPPPVVHEILRVPIDEESREMEAPCALPLRHTAEGDV